MSGLPPPVPPDPRAETTVTTGTGQVVPLAPAKGPILQTAKIGNTEVVVAQAVPWWKSFTFLGSLLPSLGSFAWALFDIAAPILTDAFSDVATGKKINWNAVGVKLLIAAWGGLLAYRRKSKNDVVK